ncbi:MAG: hypothetical protein A2148_10475 [Chloroflexi bacterium RBG_16_68_14]|nr:MAG: hypothetical protein A2148_10475 [Chloroflexi bacterium RBG_16_68_14]
MSLLLAGCGGDGDSGPAPLPTVSATPTAEGVGALRLERFHYVAAVTLREGGGEASEIVVSTEGDFQSPGRHAFTYTTRIGSDTIQRSVVLIDEEAWLREGDEPWRKATADDPELAELLSVAFSTVRPHFLGGPEFERVRESVRRLPSTEESVNDVPTDYYQVGSPGREFFEAFLAEEQLLRNAQDFRWELWLARDGAWPVRLLASAAITADLPILQELDLQPPTSWELRIDISRPNDPTLTVAPPEEGG